MLESEWLERMQEVTDDIKDVVLRAEYCFPVSVGNAEDAEHPELLEKIGLKWPGEGELG